MSIVLNEREWAEAAINTCQLGKKPSETLTRVAKYYHQIEGYTKEETREKLESFLIMCDPSVVLVKWGDTIDRVLKQVGKYEIIQLDGVSITEAELDSIQSIEGVQLQRLSFALLCISKYWNQVRGNDSGWVNTPDKDIMKMANINTSIKRQSAMFHTLKSGGLINFGKRVDSLSIQVRYIDTGSDEIVHITDFRNLGNQYMMLLGGRYIQCSHCGVTIKKNSNSHRYCADCAEEMYVRKCVDMMKVADDK